MKSKLGKITDSFFIDPDEIVLLREQPGFISSVTQHVYERVWVLKLRSMERELVINGQEGDLVHDILLARLQAEIDAKLSAE